MAVIINNKHMSHITTRGISQPGMAALGFLTGFLISLMIYFVVWLIKRRRLGINRHYSMYFWSSSRSPLYFNFARTFLPRLFFFRIFRICVKAKQKPSTPSNQCFTTLAISKRPVACTAVRQLSGITQTIFGSLAFITLIFVIQSVLK